MYSARCHPIIRSLFHVQNAIAVVASNHRTISTSDALYDNHYASLGIPANSTQNDIKAAYYKLSKVYHPDKNQGSESAAKKFREITQAYEILGNYRLRRLYDKGIIHTAGSQYAQAETVKEDIVEDDPQTKFYKSRFSKSKVTHTQGGQVPIYNFDEWARAHYGQSFERRKTAKERHDRKSARDKDRVISLQLEICTFGVVFMFVLLYYIIYEEQSHDTPKNNKTRNNDSNVRPFEK